MEELEEARMLVAGGKGYMPVEGGAPMAGQAFHGGGLCHMRLLRDGKPINRNYCAFWKLDNPSPYVEEFGSILRAQFGAGESDE